MKDKAIEKLIALEVKRQRETIDLIPSENYAPPEILRAVGSPLMNKYSEGYPGRRYYPGNQYYDQIENLAKERALKAFRLKQTEWSANVQPYSGSPANIAIYGGLMQPGDILMGMKLAAGGHLTHGHKVSFTGKFFKTFQYDISEETGLIDYAALKLLAEEHRPRVIVSGATAYPRKIDFQKIADIARRVGAFHVADISHIAGLVLAGLHPSPFPYADAVMTTTHKTLRGPRGAVIFAKKEIAEIIDKAVFPGFQGGPHNNTTAAIALMFAEAVSPAFKKYQRQIVKNAKALAEKLGEFGFSLVTGGTDTHLLLIDLRKTGLEGKVAERMLEENNIVANRNSIPGDIKPFSPSGVRIGTPATATRGMREKEMAKIAGFIHRILIKKEWVQKEVLALCKKFPLKY